MNAAAIADLLYGTSSTSTPADGFAAPLTVRGSEDPEPVTAADPLVDQAALVLQGWLDDSPSLARFYRWNPAHQRDLDTAARLRVEEADGWAHLERALGRTPAHVEALRRDRLRTPPNWHW